MSSSIVVYSNNKEIFSKNYIALNPGEMESIKLDKSLLDGDITIAVKEK